VLFYSSFWYLICQLATLCQLSNDVQDISLIACSYQGRQLVTVITRDAQETFMDRRNAWIHFILLLGAYTLTGYVTLGIMV
jgi:hypothetical protein